MSENEPRKSRISKKISRTFFNKSINIPLYESVVVEVNFDEEVEWSSLEERQRKSDNITKLLKEDFNKTTKELFSKITYQESESPINKELSDSKQDNINQGLSDHGLD